MVRREVVNRVASGVKPQYQMAGNMSEDGGLVMVLRHTRNFTARADRLEVNVTADGAHKVKMRTQYRYLPEPHRDAMFEITVFLTRNQVVDRLGELGKTCETADVVISIHSDYFEK